jgi:hypothetical protein
VTYSEYGAAVRARCYPRAQAGGQGKAEAAGSEAIFAGEVNIDGLAAAQLIGEAAANDLPGFPQRACDCRSWCRRPALTAHARSSPRLALEARRWARGVAVGYSTVSHEIDAGAVATVARREAPPLRMSDNAF